MKNQILIVGYGQAGGNLCGEFHKAGYLVHATNTAIQDLNSLDIPNNLKHHIPSTNGCSKDRSMAYKIAESNKDSLVNNIINQFNSIKYIFFAFSLGGGTGSGMSISLLQNLTKEHPHIKYGAIVIFPSDSESMQSHVNAIESYQQLISIKGLNIIPIDNNLHKDKFKVNKIFVDNFNRFVESPQPNFKGNIDFNEVEKILSSNGVTIMGELEHSTLKNNIHPTVFNACKYMMIVSKSEIDMPRLEEQYGKPIDWFVGYGDTDFLVCSGMSPYLNKVKELSDLVVVNKSLINKPKGFFVDIPLLENDEEIDFDKEFGKFMRGGK